MPLKNTPPENQSNGRAKSRRSNGISKTVPLTREICAEEPAVLPVEDTVTSAPESPSVAVQSVDGTHSETSSDVKTETQTAEEKLRFEQRQIEYDRYVQAEYARYTSLLWDQRRDSEKSTDQLILTLSTAFLGLSATTLKDITPLAQVIVLPLLFIGWFGFGIAIISTLASYSISRKCIDEHIDASKKHFYEQDTEAFNNVNKNKRNTEATNKLSAGAFLAGLLFTFLFIGINIWEAKTPMNKNKPTNTAKNVKPMGSSLKVKVLLNEGETPPTPPALQKPPQTSPNTTTNIDNPAK